jgi:hypothetical protein
LHRIAAGLTIRYSVGAAGASDTRTTGREVRGTMPVRARKLIGGVILVVGIAVYALLAMRLAVAILPRNWAAELAYAVVAGIVWVFPFRRLLYWMEGK